MSSSAREQLYSGRIVNLGLEEATLPNGARVKLEIIRHPGAAAIVPVHSDGTVTLVRQYRHAAGGMIYEIPAGVLDAGESPSTCAARELSEEVQLAGTLHELATIHTTPGFTDEQITLFLALELRPTGGQPEPDEYIEVVRISLDEALAMTRDGRITDAKTMCGLMLAREHISTHRLREAHS